MGASSPKMRIEKRKSALASVSSCLERFFSLSSRLFFFFVISTERSEWRDLINAPFGASGKPQRYLDYARYDREGGLG